MKKLIIFGDTSFSGIVAEYIHSVGDVQVVAFSVDKAFLNGRDTFEGLPLVGFQKIESLFNPRDYYFLITVSAASGVKHLNSEKFNEAIEKGFQPFSFVHPTAYVASSAKIGENVLVFPHAVIEPRAIIQDGVFIRSAAYVSHETEIGSFSYLAPRAAFSGKIKTGSHCFFGTNCTIRDQVEIGDDVIIGAGVTVLKNVPSESIIKAPENRIVPVDRYKIKP